MYGAVCFIKFILYLNNSNQCPLSLYSWQGELTGRLPLYYPLISIANFKTLCIKFSFIHLLLLYIPTYWFLQKQKSKHANYDDGLELRTYSKSNCFWIWSNKSVGLAIPTPSVTNDNRSIRREFFVPLHDVFLQKCHTMKKVTQFTQTNSLTKSSLIRCFVFR